MDRAVLETASDRYVIVEYLAEGGMGTIYLGKKLGVDGFEKEVVLKQLLPEFTREPFIEMFTREAKLSASLDHANIVRTVDLVAAGEDYFMVMEYVRGGDLRTLIRRARRRHMRFSPQAAVFIGHELLEALSYAHGKTGSDGKRLKLIHRDVSPSNILVSGAGEVKLTDFGIAKASTHLSVVYKVKGKVGYMSPEHARGEQVDARSDLFSLGVVLYEVLVGERLFVGNIMSSASMIYSQKITPPSKKRQDVPIDLDEVILKALALDPQKRYQSAEEMQEALGRVASRHRLLSGASEMASHLRHVCGDDPANWGKLETLGFDESHAHAHGTAVLTGFDQGGDSASGADPFDDSEPHATRPAVPASAFQKKELTSVIALRGDEIDIISDEEGESAALPLSPLQPARRSEPIPTPTPTPTVPFPHHSRPQPMFEGEDSQSRASTIVRTPGEGRGGSPYPARTGGGEGRGGSKPIPVAERAPPEPQRPQRNPSNEPTRVSTGKPLPITRPLPTVAAPGQHGPPPSFESTDGVKKAERARRRLLPIVIALLFIGIAVAVGVAFSGPELDVVDPPPSNPR